MEGDLEEGGYDEDEEGWKEHVGKRSKAVVRPEEIPPVPENRFLLRRGMALQEGMPDLRSVGSIDMEEPSPLFHIWIGNCHYHFK